jgi:uncharacterized membrane protein
MAMSSPNSTEPKPNRFEAFNDAILAIAITLSVVELHAPLPEEGDLAAAYLKLVPGLCRLRSQRVLIGLYWAHSHISGKLLEKTNHG